MKTMKMALLAGAAVAVSAAAAHADELSDLKAQVESLNARMAAMETAPSVPTGYQLLAISKGEASQVPGLTESAREQFSEGKNATIISVMPTADAPAGTTISWSGYVRAAVIYNGVSGDAKLKRAYSADFANPNKANTSTKIKLSADSNDDWDVKARGQLRVVATTDTAVGEVGVELKMRADFNGNGPGNVYMKTAWGYWAMTPELTLAAVTLARWATSATAMMAPAPATTPTTLTLASIRVTPPSSACPTLPVPSPWLSPWKTRA